MSNQQPETVRTCGECAHWRRQPADPLDLALPVLGSCVGAPPQLVAVPAPGKVVLRVLYPTLPPDFAACGVFKERG